MAQQTIAVIVLQLCSDGRAFVIASDPAAAVSLFPASGLVPLALIVGSIRSGDSANLVIEDTDGAYVSLTSTVTSFGTTGTTQTASVVDSIAGLATENVVVTWPTPWSNTNYNATATLEASASILGNVTVLGLVSKTVSQATFSVQNASLTAKSVTLNAVGVKV